MNKIEEFFNELQKANKSKRRLFYLLTVLATLLCYLIVAWIVGSSIRSLKVFSKEALKSPLYYGIIYDAGRVLTVISCIILTICVLIVYFRINHKNEVKITDDRGIEYMKKGVQGTARWMEKDEAKTIFNVSNVSNTEQTIYGQFSENGDEVVSHKCLYHDEARNNLILGYTGSGKSRGFVKPEIIQSIDRGDSVVCTDPSTELYGDTSEYGRSKGANVKVLNLVEPTYSDCWNCLNETIDSQTERLDETRLNEFTNIYMKNAALSDGSKSEEKFWFDSAKNIISAVIGYCSYMRESYIVEKYKELYKKVASELPNCEDEAEKMEKKSFPWCRAKIKEAAIMFGYDLAELEKSFELIKLSAPSYTINEVYENVMNFDAIEKNFKSIPNGHPAKTAYEIFVTNSASNNVRGSALQGAQMKMQILSNSKLRFILSHDGIELSECNKKQTLLYIIMSDKTTAYRPISSLIFSFLIKDAQDEFDKEQQVANEKGVPNTRLPLSIILDEFFSIGVIGGQPDSFSTTMSNARKRKLHISIIIQSFPQIKALYGEENGQNIQNNCNNIIFLGCNDPETAQFISKISGEATVLSERHIEGGNLFANAGNQINVTTTQRPLLTIGEALNWKGKVFLKRAGENPLILNIFDWREHPAYKKGYLISKSLYSTIQSLDDRMENDVIQSETNDYLTDLENSINGLMPTKHINPETGEIEEIKNEGEEK